MDAAQILSADLLDIIFDGRNKEYGAYELRKSYNNRLLTAMGILGLALTGVIIFILTFSNNRNLPFIQSDIDDYVLSADPSVTEPLTPLPPARPKAPAPPRIRTRAFTTNIRIVREATADEMPPEVASLEHSAIGRINTYGISDEDIVAPPAGQGNNGVVAGPAKEESDRRFIPIEIESEYPGGTLQWGRYLSKTLRYPEDAVANGIQGIVVVQFIVDKSGMVSNVEAISGPAELYAEAVRVISRSGKWTPAIQNGQGVKSYKRQPIVFRLDGF
jgi:periplasmic protein TonB